MGTLAAAPTPPITIILDRSHYISLTFPALLLGSKPVPYVSNPLVCLSQGTGRNGSLWSYLVVWGRVRHKRPQTQPSSSVITLLVFLTQLFKAGKTLMLIMQCDSYFYSSLRPQMSCETNWGDGHGGEYWPVMVYHDRRHSWDAAMINDHNYEYIPILHPKHLMHLAECIIQWPHYFCLILLHASPFSSSIERFVLFLLTVICNYFG